MYNKNEIRHTFSSEKSLGDIFFRIEQELKAKGQAVCRFSVNGMSLSEADEKKFAKFDLSDVEQIEVESEMMDLLLIQVIDSWIDSLPKLILRTDELANKFKDSDREGLFKSFVDLVDSCQFLIDSLISLRTVLDSESVKIHIQWQESQKLTAHAISEALEAFEKNDFVLLADILEYDLGNCLQNWLETLISLKEYVEKKASGTMDK